MARHPFADSIGKTKYRRRSPMSDRSKFDIELPQSIIDSFARHLVSEIRKYYDSEEGQAAFEEWLKQQENSQDA